MRKLVIASFFIIAFSGTKACDICGKSGSNFNPLLFPHLSKNYLGFSWIQSKYSTYAPDGGEGSTCNNTFILSAQYSPFRKLQLAVVAPWQSNKMENLDGQKKIFGVGDITLLANYRLFNKQNSNWRHTIVVGAGAKLPTGKYTPVKLEEAERQNFQVGSGSMDYLVKASCHLGWRQLTVTVANSYKYNTQNADHYRYGDVLINSITALYQKQLKSFSLSPYVQLISETHLKDADSRILQRYSGGQVIYTCGGLDVNVNKVSGGLNYQFVPYQQLAGGSIIVKSQFSAHLLINL